MDTKIQLREAAQSLLHHCPHVGWIAKLQPVVEHLEKLGICTTPSERAETLWTLGRKVDDILWKIDLPQMATLEVPLVLQENFLRGAEILEQVEKPLRRNELGLSGVIAPLRAVGESVSGPSAGGMTSVARASFVAKLTALRDALCTGARCLDAEVEQRMSREAVS